MEVITARPSSMSVKKYHKIRAANNKKIKDYLKHGTLIHTSSSMIKDKDGNLTNKRTKGVSLIGSVKNLKGWK